MKFYRSLIVLLACSVILPVWPGTLPVEDSITYIIPLQPGWNIGIPLVDAGISCCLLIALFGLFGFWRFSREYFLLILLVHLSRTLSGPWVPPIFLIPTALSFILLAYAYFGSVRHEFSSAKPKR